MSDRVPCSVVVPAYDEAASIARCVRTLTAGAEPGEVEVVVVPNGCSDDTAGIARGLGIDGVTVVELEVGSKTAALDAGDAAATRFPRFYVDADVEIGVESLRRIAAVLADPASGVGFAGPFPRYDLTGRPWAVRAYHEVWTQLPFMRAGIFGSGVYAVSAEGRSRWGAWPTVSGDDEFARRHFTKAERRAVAGTESVVHPPTSLSAVLAVRTRAHRGNAALEALDVAGAAGVDDLEGDGPRALLDLVRSKPRLLPAAVVYAAVTTLGKVRARRSPAAVAWERDSTTR